MDYIFFCINLISLSSHNLKKKLGNSQPCDQNFKIFLLTKRLVPAKDKLTKIKAYKKHNNMQRLQHFVSSLFIINMHFCCQNKHIQSKLLIYLSY